MAEREGQQFGNYRLARLLGKGAFAEVYLAVQVYLGTEAAIKVLRTHLASAAEVEKFRVEARTIATLVHPHIVRVLDFGVQDDTPYLLMDYAPNGSLRQLFPADTPLAPAAILPYFKQIADALHYAHEQRLVHRDIKPENMLLGRNNEVLLSDFGIATTAQSTSYEETQGVAGTAAYMAPEQLQGHPRPASDQYSLGVVVYEWLSGARPFHGTFTAIAAQHVLAPPPPLREKIPTLAPAVEEVVLTALAKDPRQRFGSVRAFATALEQAIQGSAGQTFATRMQAPPAPISPAPGGAAGGPGAALYASPTVLSGPASPASGPAGSAVYSATTVISGPGGPAAPSVPDPSVRSGPPGGYSQPPAVPPAGPPAYPAANAGWGGQPGPTPSYNAPTFGTGLPAVSPLASPPGQPPPKGGISRRTILITGATGLVLLGSGTALLLLSQKSGGAPQTNAQASPTQTGGPGPTNTAMATATNSPTSTATETPTNTAVPAPQPGDRLYSYQGQNNVVDALAWSPNSQRLASGSFDYTVKVWDALTGRNPLTYRGHSDQVWAVAWSPDGSKIASAGKDKTVQVWDATNGTQLSNYTGHSAEVAGVAWSPDSTTIASASYDDTVRVWVATSQQFIQTYMGHSDHVWAVDWSPDGSKIASGSKDKTVQVWDATSGTLMYTYTGHSDGVTSVAWSPNGQRIASASDDGTVQVWDALTGSNPVVYQGHSGGVTAVVWSPDGSKLASASKDTTAQVWKASNASNILTYRKHGSAVDDIRWSPNAKEIASASADKTAQVWLAP